MQCVTNDSTESYSKNIQNVQFCFYFIRRENSLYKVNMYHDVDSTTKNV